MSDGIMFPDGVVLLQTILRPFCEQEAFFISFRGKKHRQLFFAMQRFSHVAHR